MRTKDTFYALSTPKGVSATATIRISGPSSIKVVSLVTKKPTEYFKHKKSNLLNIYNKNNNLVDKAIVVSFHSPRSYTGEDLVEVHTHGNPVVIKNLFKCLSEKGLRFAAPGEFTKTAYINNKIDLVQAEATLSLINSQSSGGVGLSLNNLGGALSSRFVFIRKNIIQALSVIEYELDISETDNTDSTQRIVVGLILESLKNIKSLIASYKTARVLNDGVRVAIVGKPNVGKSTLFNALLDHDRSIVTNTPGTTRDIIESIRTVSGYSITFVDTAGIRKTKNSVERAGVKRSLLELSSADIIISMIDPIKKEMGFKKPKNKPVITVHNKIDTISSLKLKKLKKNKDTDVYISAKTKDGIDKLLSAIEKNIESTLPETESFFITSKRQEEVLLSIAKTLTALSILRPFDLEVFAFELKDAVNQFNWLLGETTPDDVLNEVFSRFCVGK